ncbi:MAG: polA [Deltaproteobacteria bacterium]|nr:polA [Deltaproteobacteria bacterium]
MPQPRPVLYLIDASAYVYRAFFALPALSSPGGLPTNAAYGFTSMLLKLLRDIAPQYIGAVFDAPGPTFRAALFERYKANRPAMPADLAAQFPLVHEIVNAFALRALSIAGVEADDVIASVAERMAGQDADIVVITSDKDLMQLVGPHVQLWDTMRNRRCDAEAVRQRFGVAPEQVVEVMGLMGDPIDNIPGVPGIGEKTASALIARFGTIDSLLAHLDELAASTDIRGARKLAALLAAHAETARLSRDLARVRRDVPIDCALADFHYHGPDLAGLRTVFTRLGFQRLVRDLPSPAAPTRGPLRVNLAPDELAAFVSLARLRGRVAFACDGTLAGDGATGFVLATDGEPPIYVSGVAPRAQTDLFHSATPVAQLPDDLRALLHDAQIEKIGHDVKHDLRLLDPVCAQAMLPAFDIKVASYLLETSATHSLEDLASSLLGVSLAGFRENREALAAGVAVLPALRDVLAARLQGTDMERLFFDVEMPLVQVLAAMERCGVQLDVDALTRMSHQVAARLDALIEEIYTLAGGPFNIASPAQLRQVLFDRLGLSRKGVRRGKTGLSTDVDVLTRLANEHPLPAKILEYRNLAKLKSTYLEALPAAISSRTGRLHTTFNQTITATGRLSSSDPNLQNIPTRGAEGQRIRAAFIGGPGSFILAADYSQIELRILAHLSDDPVLVTAFRNGDDIHARTATEIFGVPGDAITADMRRTAKVINFGIIYGMGPQRLARELGVPQEQAEHYIASYFARYAGVRRYLDKVRTTAQRQGYVVTLLGRRRTLPDITSPHRGVAQAAERTAINTPIQGSAADLIKVAMVAIHRRLQREQLRTAMLLQVHDELVFQVPEAERDAAMAIAREEMEGAFPLTVPLRVDLGWGRNWAEAH